MIVPTLRLGLGLRFPGPGPSFASTAAIVATGPVYTTNFTALSSLPTGVSLSRATTGTDFDGSGVLQTAAIDAPRFDHAWNGSAWIATGLLIEEQRTNLALHSQLIGGTDWSSSSAAITTNTTDLVSPDGTNNATKIVTVGGSDNAVYQSQTGLNANGRTWTVSFWAKVATGTLNLPVFGDDSVGTFFLNPASVTVALTTTWQRFIVTGTYPGTITPLRYGLGAFNSLTTAATIYIFGFQIEQASFASSYIPTTTAAVTRSADIPSSSSPLTGYLAAGPSVWEFQDEATGAIARAAYAAGAFDWPVNKWYRSMGVYAAGTDTSSHMTVGGAY